MEMVDTLRPVSLVRSCVWDLKEEEEEVLSLDLDLNYRLLRAEATISLVNSRYLYMRMRNDCYHPPLDCSLPSSICRFWNLQTLLVDDNFSTVIVLPAEIWCMTQIRHMKSVGKFHLPDPPASGEDGMVLGNLQTLATIENFECNEEVIKRIPNLRKLGICTMIKEKEYCLSNLACLHKLESLQITVWPTKDYFVVNLNLPRSLKKLQVNTWLFKCWQELWEEMGKLPLLEKLLVYAAESEEQFRELETVEGTFPRLKFLGIHYSEHLEIWTMESSNFPCLERLDLIGVIKLKEVPSELADISTLEMINVKYCSKCVGESAKNCMGKQPFKSELYESLAPSMYAFLQISPFTFLHFFFLLPANSQQLVVKRLARFFLL